MVCDSLDLLPEAALLMFVAIRYAPQHHHMLCSGLEPQRYLQSLGRVQIAFDSRKVRT